MREQIDKLKSHIIICGAGGTGRHVISELLATKWKFVVIDSPYRAFVRPLLAYVDALHSQSPSAFVTIVLPEFLPAHWWERFLHNQTAANLRRAFEPHPNVAVVLVWQASTRAWG